MDAQVLHYYWTPRLCWHCWDQFEELGCRRKMSTIEPERTGFEFCFCSLLFCVAFSTSPLWAFFLIYEIGFCNDTYIYPSHARCSGNGTLLYWLTSTAQEPSWMLSLFPSSYPLTLDQKFGEVCLPFSWFFVWNPHWISPRTLTFRPLHMAFIHCA